MVNMDLLQGLDADEATRVLALGKRMTVESGGVLFRLGDRADSLYLVARGRIRLTLPDAGARTARKTCWWRRRGPATRWAGAR